ncbi:ephrin type-A receptor 7-like protein [Lates japonicus]|uniref:Ephrin type-A receptor 7-like protein n=1 Tax=Lates japonicus TaxID=270547 RepID=A0AAD3MTC3_LATJO|nr:ephrin type-A receptor 7-like protein [Lates japonicus]
MRIGLPRVCRKQCDAAGLVVGFVPQQVGLTERTVDRGQPSQHQLHAYRRSFKRVSELLPNKRFDTGQRVNKPSQSR